MLGRHSVTLWLVLMLFAGAFYANAQGLAQLVGSVTDPSGSPVPGASLTVTEVATGQSRSVMTGSEGYYAVPSLRPTLYKVTLEAAGFRAMKSEGITLVADQDATINFKLQLGAVTETVSVTANASQVDTSTGTLKQVVDGARIVELPLNGRNAAALALTVAGAVLAPGTGADQGQTKSFPGVVTVSTNGSRQNQTSFKLDGANNFDSYSNVNAPFPFPDALQEFSVQTSNYSAESGQNAGGVVNVITKSGTNQIHGDAFEFVRNAEFNARNYFAARRDQLKRNQYGATIGGPVVVPGYSGRDKTFFFFGYQGTQIRNIQGGLSAFVPTPANLSGDFSAISTANNPANPLQKAITMIDPANGNQPFPGNRIPVSRFDPASLAVTKFLPIAGAAANGLVFYSKPVKQKFGEEIVRIDHSFSSKDRISGRYFADDFDNQPVWEATKALTYAAGGNIFYQNALIQETHIFTPRLLNDFRLNFSRENTLRSPAAGVPSVNDFGVKLYQPPDKAIEGFAVTGFFSFGDNPKARFTRNNLTLGDDLRLTMGRHSLAFGFSGELARFDLDNQFQRNGSFGFTSDATNYALSAFFLGKLRTFRQGGGEFENVRNKFFGLYLQDDFRLSHRLTLNLGLRWEPDFPWHEVRSRVEQFRPDAYYRGEKSTQFTNAPPGLFFQGDPGVPEGGVRPAYNGFSPRVGFAYDVFGDGKTSLRGGGGVFFDTRQSAIFGKGMVDASPFSPQLQMTDPPGPLSNPLAGIQSPFPAQFPPLRDAQIPLPALAVTYDPGGQYRIPYISNWNLSIERQLANNWLARVAYVGSHTTHLHVVTELNPAVYTPGSKLSTDQRRLFQGLQTISYANQSGNSRYNSLQLSLDKRFARGFTIQANYTWSKSLDAMPVDWNSQGPLYPSANYAYPWYFKNADLLDRGPSDFDRRHRFVGSFVWKLPLMTDASRLARTILGGWELTSLFQAQTGGPLTIKAGRDQSQTGLTFDRALLTGSPYGAGGCVNVAPCVEYLNPGSFALPTIGGFGDVGKGLLRAPNSITLDSGFFRTISVSEHFQVQLRAEFFNLLNRVNFNSPTNSVSSAGFGSIRGSSDPRIGQLALKLFF